MQELEAGHQHPPAYVCMCKNKDLFILSLLRIYLFILSIRFIYSGNTK